MVTFRAKWRPAEMRGFEGLRGDRGAGERASEILAKPSIRTSPQPVHDGRRGACLQGFHRRTAEVLHRSHLFRGWEWKPLQGSRRRLPVTGHTRRH